MAPLHAPANLPDLSRIRRVLIIRLSAIGDVIHALPLSAALKQAHPHLELTWLVEEMSADVVTDNPYLHEILVIPRARWKQGRLRSPRVWREYLAFLAGLRRRRFDLTLDLQGYGKTALYALATGAKYRFGWHRMRDGAELVSSPLPKRPESLHRVDWYLDVARALGVNVVPSQVTFPLVIKPEARARVDGLLRAGGIAPGQPYAVLNASANDAPRRWGTDDFGEVAAGLARQFGLRCVLVGVPKETEANRRIGERFCQRTEQSGGSPADVAPPLDLTGQTTLAELVALVQGCTLQVSGDTGSLHLAAALQRPVVAMYGASDPHHAGPWGQAGQVLARRDLCDPACSLRRCVRGEADPPADPVGTAFAPCLRAITPDAVLQRVPLAMPSSRALSPSRTPEPNAL